MLFSVLDFEVPLVDLRPNGAPVRYYAVEATALRVAGQRLELAAPLIAVLDTGTTGRNFAFESSSTVLQSFQINFNMFLNNVISIISVFCNYQKKWNHVLTCFNPSSADGSPRTWSSFCAFWKLRPTAQKCCARVWSAAGAGGDCVNSVSGQFCFAVWSEIWVYRWCVQFFELPNTFHATTSSLLHYFLAESTRAVRNRNFERQWICCCVRRMAPSSPSVWVLRIWGQLVLLAWILIIQEQSRVIWMSPFIR